MIDFRKANTIYNKSVGVLKQVQLKNGGCLATPKGERYPYIYPRDHAMIILGFLSANLTKRAKKGLDFILGCQSESGAFPQRIDTEGNDTSYKPVQIDGTGLVLHAFSEYIRHVQDFGFAKDYWENIRRAVKYIISNFFEEKKLIYTPNSVHEFPPTEQGLEIWANCVCYAALKRMYELSCCLKREEYIWGEFSSKIKDGILKYMWNSRKKTFVKNIRIRESSSVLVDPDASKYAIAEFGVLEDKDKRVALTVEDIEKNLWNKELRGICRYPKYEGRNNGG